MTNLSSVEIYRRAFPGRLDERPRVDDLMTAVRRVRDVLAGIVPVDLTGPEAAAIRLVAAEAEAQEGAA